MDQLIYIAAALVIGLLIGFIALSIKWLNKTMLRNVRSHTLDLLSVYDDLLAEKSRELSATEENLRIQQENAAKLEQEQELPECNIQEGVSPSILLAVADRSAEASYRDRSIGMTYQQIRRNFSFQPGELLPAMSRQAQEVGGPAGQMLKVLNHDTIYALSTLTEQQQLTVLSTSLPEEGISLLNTYMECNPKFNVFGFYDYLKSCEAEEPKPIRLYVPEGVAAPDSGKVEILVDREICEGFQVEMSGKLYDYCIKTKELS